MNTKSEAHVPCGSFNQRSWACETVKKDFKSIVPFTLQEEAVSNVVPALSVNRNSRLFPTVGEQVSTFPFSTKAIHGPFNVAENEPKTLALWCTVV